MTSPGIFTLRTYAIYGRSWIVLLLLTVPGLGQIAPGIVHFLFSFNFNSADVIKVGNSCWNSSCASSRSPNWSCRLWLCFFTFCIRRVCFSFSSHMDVIDAFYSRSIVVLASPLISSQMMWSILFPVLSLIFLLWFSQYTALVVLQLRVGKAA